MIRLSSWGLGLAVLSASTAAFAQDAEPEKEPAAEAAPAAAADASAGVSSDGGSLADKKIRLGLRLGYAFALGNLDKNDKMSDGTKGQIPIWIDAGYMVTPNILVGLYGQYGFVQLKDCTDCSAHDIRFGLQGQYHLAPAGSADPWLGLGFGYEWLGLSQGGASGTIKGFQFLNLQGGADFKVSDAFAVGPFVDFSLGQYSSISVEDQSADIPEKAMHEWLTLGVKGTFGL
ncbi:MAG TPA: hypothetical protein VGJ91_01075 [Polyangiaceae bacterium]|jgi:outer membrane protein W